MDWGCTHQAVAGAEGSQASLQRPAPDLPDHMAGVVGVRLDLGAGDAPKTPLADKPWSQEVPVQAQVEFQGLPFVLQLIEGRKLAPGGRRPPVKGPVGQVIGQEGSALVDLDGMDDVAAGARRGRLWEERVQWLPAGFLTFPLPPLPAARCPTPVAAASGTQTPAGSGNWWPLGRHGAGTAGTPPAPPALGRSGLGFAVGQG